MTIEGEDKSDNDLGMWWFHFDTNKLLPSPGQTLTTIPTFSTSTHHHHHPLSFKKKLIQLWIMACPPVQFFFFFHLIWPLHNYACPLFGDFICFNDGIGPPLGKYFILFSIFFSWSNLFKLTTTRKWQGDNVNTMKKREIKGSAGYFQSFDILSNSQASPARSPMPTCVSIPFCMKCEPAQIKIYVCTVILFA